MSASAVGCVRHLVDQYRRFLRTSYRFLDPKLRDQFEAHLAEADVVVRGPYVTLSQDFAPGRALRALVEAGEADAELLRISWSFGERPLHKHQEEALSTGRAGRPFVVTTGTGSGKTESFLLPVFDAVLRRKRAGTRGVQAILLYPQNALANDQLERLRRMLRGSGSSLSFGLYTGDSETSSKHLKEEPAETERTSRDEIRRAPPDLLLTNYKQLEFLLVRREDRLLFTPALRFLVLDELHSYRGALATEIACLIRRLVAHAGLAPGELIGIGTSATVASGQGGPEALAGYATALLWETLLTEDVVGETVVPRPAEEAAPYEPPLPLLEDAELEALDSANDAAAVALAERLTGRACPPKGALPKRIAAALAGNRVVSVLEDVFSAPASLGEACRRLRAELPSRADVSDAVLRRELEAYLLIGSLGDENDPPRLRPKLHSFFHGIYDVALCLNPACRTLVPHGGAACPTCHSAARPAALCRTCGQDFVKARLEGEKGPTVGTGDFFSDEKVVFLTPRIHPLATAMEQEEGEGEAEEEPKETRRDDRSHRLETQWLCPGCGWLGAREGACPVCHRSLVRTFVHRGRLSTCPACGDVYTRGDIVTPLRTGTASTVSALTTHHLDRLEKEDRRVLVFADNRQDVAHQAGYTADKHRTFALRHVIADQVRRSAERGVYLQELPEIVFDRYRGDLGIIRSRPSRPEHESWIAAITYELAGEVTRYSRQRGSLENLGLVAVEHEGLDELATDAAFAQACRTAGIEGRTGVALVRGILDVMRRNRAVDYKFFQEYVDPSKKAEYRKLEAEPYNVRFTDRDLGPKAYALGRPDHIRKAASTRVLGFYQENQSSGSLTSTQRLARKVLGTRPSAEAFLTAVVPLLAAEERRLLVKVSITLPKSAETRGLVLYQVNHKLVRLVAQSEGFRCNACQQYRPYSLSVCPTPRCGEGTLLPDRPDPESYYVALYTARPPQRLAVEEHSAQIDGDERAKRETRFKEGKLDALVCTPTLELGVDIGPLLTVVLRNAPPTPANYVQRVGRAGRRLRIGFVSTFCGGGPHDLHAFQDPEWLVAGHFSPPRLRLDNPRVVERHLRAYLAALLVAQLPRMMGDFLDDMEKPSRWKPELVQALFDEIRRRRGELGPRLAALLEKDRKLGRTSRFDLTECERLVDGFEADLRAVLERWWKRVQQLDQEFQAYSRVGSTSHDMRKAAARQRAFREITQDREHAYVLNYLSVQGLFPAYQFPVETFSLDPGVDDTPTLYRPSVIAIEEFAPGNFVYANGHKLRSIRALYSGGPGAKNQARGRSDAESSGRLRPIQFCDACGHPSEELRNSCGRCGNALDEAVSCVFVDAFEAEESLRIGSDEESRQRQSFDRRETLLPKDGDACELYPYPFAPLELRRQASILTTNWGRVASKTAEGSRFELCPDCGRHKPPSSGTSDSGRHVKQWLESHSRICKGVPAPLVLAHEFQADALVLSVSAPADEQKMGRQLFSPMLVTLAQALLVGGATVLELEPFEIGAFPRLAPKGSLAAQVVFFESVPGGAGYVEEMARRLPEVAEAARDRLYAHRCQKACYLCLKHYRNQQWHGLFDKNLVIGSLHAIASMDAVSGIASTVGAGEQRLIRELDERRSSLLRAPGTKGPQSPIEVRLLEAIRSVGLKEPVCQREILREGSLFTVPDFAYLDEKIAIYCDGFAYHGNPETLELDSKKRNWLQSAKGGGWTVLTYWGRTVNNDAQGCAREIGRLLEERSRQGTST